MDRDHSIAAPQQVHFAACRAALELTHEIQQGARIGGEAQQGRPHYLLQGRIHQFGEVVVGVENGARGRNGERPLLHLLHQNAVRRFGALQRVNALLAVAHDDQGIHFAGPDGAHDLLRLAGVREVITGISLRCRRDFCRGFCRVRVWRHLEDLSCKSSPASMAFSSVISPMILRSGKGRHLTSVGAATMCSSRASAGRWYKSMTDR